MKLTANVCIINVERKVNIFKEDSYIKVPEDFLFINEYRRLRRIIYVFSIMSNPNFTCGEVNIYIYKINNFILVC